jgi:Fe-S-cluster containining protein
MIAYVGNGLRRQWADEVLIDVACQHITDSGCAIYKDRPLACILFPWESHPLMKEHCELMRRNFPTSSDS